MAWISVKDRLPEERTHVLTFEKENYIYPMKVNYILNANHPDVFAYGFHKDITHWMELPEYPKIPEASKFRHKCPEWDYMDIDETYPEFECCICFTKVEAEPS